MRRPVVVANHSKMLIRVTEGTSSMGFRMSTMTSKPESRGNRNMVGTSSSKKRRLGSLVDILFAGHRDSDGDGDGDGGGMGMDDLDGDGSALDHEVNRAQEYIMNLANGAKYYNVSLISEAKVLRSGLEYPATATLPYRRVFCPCCSDHPACIPVGLHEVDVMTVHGYEQHVVPVLSTCPRCEEEIELANPRLVGLTPCDSRERQALHSCDWKRATFLLDDDLMRQLTQHFIKYPSFRGTYDFLVNEVRSTWDPSRYGPFVGPSQDLRRSLAHVLPALVRVQLTDADDYTLINMAANVLSYPAFSLSSMAAPYTSCLACTTYTPPSPWGPTECSWTVWYDLLCTYVERDSILRERACDSPILERVLDARHVISDLLQSIPPDSPYSQPALLRLQSTAEGIHVMSQANLDGTFKVNLRNMNRETKDTLPIPDRSDRIDKTGTQIPYPVLVDPLAAHKHVSELVVPETEVLPAARQGREASNQHAGACSDFKAAKELAGRKDRAHGKDKRLYEGLFLSTCTHRCVHIAINITTGEQHVYPTIVLSKLADLGRVRQVNYDVACRLSGRFKALFDRLKVDPTTPHWRDVDAPYLFVGPFHINCHKPSCQHGFGSLYMEGCGHANGELAESVNAHLKDKMHGASYMHGINYLQHEDQVMQKLNEDSRNHVSKYLVDTLHRQQKIAAETSQELNAQAGAIATELGSSPSSADTQAEYAERCERGRIFHQSLKASAPPLDGAAFVPVEVRAFWNRLLRVGIEIQDGVFQPSLNIDEEIAHYLPDYRPVPREKERDGKWFIVWEFAAGGARTVTDVGSGLVDWLMPSLNYVLQRGLALHVVQQVAAFQEALVAYDKEEEADRGRDSASRDMLAAARREVVDGLRNLQRRFVKPLLNRAIAFVEAQHDCSGWAGICRTADFKNFKLQLETMCTWEAPTFTESVDGKAMPNLEDLTSFVPLDFSSSDAMVESAGSTTRYCLQLFRLQEKRARALEGVNLVFSEMIAVLGNLTSTLVHEHYLIGEIDRLTKSGSLDFSSQSSLNNLKVQLNKRVGFVSLHLEECLKKFRKEAQPFNGGSTSFPAPHPKIKQTSHPLQPPQPVRPVSIPSSSAPMSLSRDPQLPLQQEAPAVAELQRARRDNDLKALENYFYQYFKALYTNLGYKIVSNSNA